MEYLGLSYIFGLSTIFFGMMTWLFGRRSGLLYRTVAILTATLALGYVKDFIVAETGMYSNPRVWDITTAIDMVAVPMYAFVLTELVRPGLLSRRSVLVQELPFVALPLLYIILGNRWIFYLEVGFAAVYGTGVLIWTAVNIPRYNRHLKQLYSYTENINLNWLKVILYTFYVILGLWIFDCLVIHLDMECVYMLCNLCLWIVISYFLYRHQSVMGELADCKPEQPAEIADEYILAAKIEKLFSEEHIYLNPNLKLSDIAIAAGSNRTYVSKFFNRDASTNFYEYVNGLRIEHACRLLTETDLTIQEVAQKSGFSSGSVFSRVFSKHKDRSPSAYRAASINRRPEFHIFYEW